MKTILLLFLPSILAVVGPLPPPPPEGSDPVEWHGTLMALKRLKDLEGQYPVGYLLVRRTEGKSVWEELPAFLASAVAEPREYDRILAQFKSWVAHAKQPYAIIWIQGQTVYMLLRTSDGKIEYLTTPRPKKIGDLKITDFKGD